MIDKIKCPKRIGNDIHRELIAMWNHYGVNGSPLPTHISEEEYNEVRKNKERYPDYYVGLVGFNATFGSKYFGGYARGFQADGVTPRDIPNEALRNLQNQIPLIKDVEFLCFDYIHNQYSNISHSLIYCDPPYQGTTKYHTKKFDYETFWSWCRKMSKNNYVFISEYHAPQDFECIWSINTTTSLKVNTHEERVEKLFVYNQ